MTEDIVQLSEREREILKLVATGASNQQIAGDLGISINTVKVHIRNIFGKIGAASRTEATIYAMRAGLVNVSQANGAATPPVELPSVPPPVPVLHESITPQRGFLQRHAIAIGTTIGAFLIVLAVIWFLQREQLPGTPTATPAPTSEIQVSVLTPTWMARKDFTGLLSGGGAASYDGRIYVISGRTKEGITGALQRYDPATDTWATLSTKPAAVGNIHAAVLNGKIYVPGGERADGTVSDQLDVYDPARETWSTAAKLPAPRSAYSLVAVEGRLYLFGGWDGTQFRAEVFMYDPTSDSWSELGTLPTPRAYSSAVAVENKVYVIGGENESGPLATNEQFTTVNTTQPWAVRAPLPKARSRFGAGAINNNIFVLGGAANDEPLYYDILTDNWVAVQPPALPLGTQPAVAAHLGSLFIVSGDMARPTAGVYELRVPYVLTLPMQ